jgi:RNase P protein component
LKRRILAAALPFGSADRAIVIYARPNAASLPYSELKSELTELLARVIK